MKKIFLLLLVIFLTGCTSDSSKAIDPLSSVNTKDLKAQVPKIPEVQPMVGLNIDELIDQIDRQIESMPISKEDINRGWYPANGIERKVGTPLNWEKVTYLENEFWVSPRSKVLLFKTMESLLCEESAGVYRFSCIETEQEGCDYIPTSTCDCPEDTAWSKEQGCLLVDRAGDWRVISEEDLRLGWYLGQQDQKKKDTPLDWHWVNWGEHSRWAKGE